MKVFQKMAGLIAGGFLALGLQTSAWAVIQQDTFITYYFSGACADCNLTSGAPVTGELTLRNYTQGDDITGNQNDSLGNFFSFTYNGSNLVTAFTVTEFESAQVSGSMLDIPGPNDFLIVFDDGIYFQTLATGGFEVCAPGTQGYYSGVCSFYNNTDMDNGNNAQWNAERTNGVPEPGSLALLGLALVGLAAVRRKA